MPASSRQRLADPAPLREQLPQRRPAGPPRSAPVSRGEIIRSMLPGSRRPRSRRELMRAFHADPRLAGVRRDRGDNLVTTMRLLARAASWADGDADPRATARPTRAAVAAAAEYCIATWKVCRALLEAWGWLRVLRQGRSEKARHESDREDLHYSGNDAAVFLLVIPRIPAKTRPARPAPSAPRVTQPPTPADVSRSNPAPGVDNRDGQQPDRTGLRPGSLAKPAVMRALQGREVLDRLSERAALRSWRPFERAGWSVADWLHAVDWRPDGRQHRRKPSEVRYPASWLRSRLSLWIDGHGRPLQSVSQAAAAARAVERASRARILAGLEAAAGAAVLSAGRVPGADPGPHAGQLRDQMGWPTRPPAGGRQPEEET